MLDLFGPVIHEYTDRQALEDGVLLELDKHVGRPLEFRGRRIDRITRTLMVELLPFLIDASDPFGDAPARIQNMTRGHKQCLRSTLRTKLDYARRVHADRYHLLPNIILARNERDNWTLMLPEDD